MGSINTQLKSKLERDKIAAYINFLGWLGNISYMNKAKLPKGCK